MPRKFDGDRLIIASHNQGKIREIQDLLGEHVGGILSAGELDLPEPEETGKTFMENAVLKAVAASAASGEICLADDSGLSVTALNGDPGVYSARWAGEPRNFAKAMEVVESRLAGIDDRRARFICVLALAWPDGHVETVKGETAGTLVWPPRGDKGFGYDPMFQPEGYDLTFGEMERYEKRQLSHRARAFDNIMKNCFF